MNAIKNDVLRLTEKELAAANKKFPLFNGKHEAYAIILEESEEAQEEMQNLECLVSDYWNIEIALKKMGIEDEAQLKEAIRKMKPLNISTMTAPVVSERKVGYA